MTRSEASGASRPLPAERVFSLVATLLASKRPLTREEILDRLHELYVPHGFGEPDPETLRKMFERDKRLVKDMGLPLVTVEPGQPGGEDLEEGTRGYRIEERDMSVPEVRLSSIQRLLLLAVAETLMDAPEFPLRDELAVAVHKILLAAGEAGDEVSRDAPFPCRFVLGGESRPRSSLERSLTEAAFRAIDERKSLVLSYRAAGGEVTERVVDPYGLAPVDGSWLLTGHCHLRDARRTFAMHGVMGMRLLRPGDAGPDFDPPGSFDASEVARLRPWQYEVHEPRRVVLEADEEFAWLATGLIGREPDASGLYALESTNADALVELTLMHGPRIRLVAPPDLRRRVVEEARLLGRGGWERPQADEPARSVEGEADVSPGSRPRSRRDDATSRLRRFMFIVAYLSRHPDARLDRLCSILEVDEAVLLSDLERLSVCGVYPSTDFRLFDVAVDPERGRVHFRRNPVPGLERPVRLTRREVMALLLGFKLVSDGIAPPFDWTADRVMEEVLGLAGQDLADAVRELEKRVRLGSHHDLSWDTFYEVSMGVCNRRCVEIEYYTQSRDAMSRRTVRPFVLVCTLGRWYLLGHCEWRQEVRTFRVDRIRSAHLLDRDFEPPAEFDPGRHLGAGIYPDPDPAGDRRVVVEFEPAFLARSRGRESMELLRASRDGEVTFSVHPDRYEGFLTWLISHTTRFRIVHPEELGRCAERRRSRILSAYD